MEVYSLFELNEYVRRVIALNFAEPIWINAEISQVKTSRGQVYIDLIQKDENSDSLMAQSSAIIWYKNYLFLKKKLGEILDDILVDGVEVKLKVLVEFHERFGFKLNVQDIDPSFTLGKLELQKKAIIDRLRKEELIDQNSTLPLPRVIQKIAVISSSTAAGLQDFEKQLLHNPQNYQFRMTLFQSAVQGSSVEREMVNALKIIAEEKDRYDCIAILRGGGSRVDLSGFDNYAIGKAIANSPLPILTGIGHEIDMSIADLCAHTSLKTPTAIANFIIDKALYFESDIYELQRAINNSVQLKLNKEEMRLQEFYLSFHGRLNGTLNLHSQKLDFQKIRLIELVKSKLSFTSQKLNNATSKIKLLEPSNILKKGYSITRKNGKAVMSVNGIKPGDEIETEFKNGNIKSTVK